MRLLVDLKGLLYRSAWAKDQIRSQDGGLNLTPIHGAFRTLMTVRNRFPVINQIVFCADPVVRPAQNWRKAMDPRYKNAPTVLRDATPKFEELAQRRRADVMVGLRLFRELATGIACWWLEDHEFEADDLIAWMLERDQTRTVVLSNDQDLFQLVSPSAHILVSRSRQYELITPESFDLTLRTILGTKLKRTLPYMVPSQHWLAYKCLVGDEGDNVPGLKGVGPIRALQILRAVQHMTDVRDPLTLLTAWVRNEIQNPNPSRVAVAMQQSWDTVVNEMARNTSLMSLLPGIGHRPATTLRDSFSVDETTIPYVREWFSRYGIMSLAQDQTLLGWLGTLR